MSRSILEIPLVFKLTETWRADEDFNLKISNQRWDSNRARSLESDMTGDLYQGGSKLNWTSGAN